MLDPDGQGVVTKFVLKTHAQTDVWGGLMTITGLHLDEVNNATVKFQQSVSDPKAAVLPTYNFVLGAVRAALSILTPCVDPN